MTTSYTLSDAVTFTVTHARHLAAKVATDLKRMQRFYGSPSDSDIIAYEGELTLLIKEGYLSEITYGFYKDGQWIAPMLRYTARDLVGSGGDDDDPGRVRPGADTSGASFYSYLIRNSAWNLLSATARESFERQLPLRRAGAAEPTVRGYLSTDRTYSAAGRALERASIKNFQ